MRQVDMMLQNSQVGPWVVAAMAGQNVHGSDLRECWRVVLETCIAAEEQGGAAGSDLIDQLSAALSEAGFGVVAAPLAEGLGPYSDRLMEFLPDVWREWGEDLPRVGEELAVACEWMRYEWAQSAAEVAVPAEPVPGEWVMDEQHQLRRGLVDNQWEREEVPAAPEIQQGSTSANGGQDESLAELEALVAELDRYYSVE